MVINFFGRRGSGKTTAISGTLKFCRPPVLIVDVLGNFLEPKFNPSYFGIDPRQMQQSDNLSDAMSTLAEYLKKRKRVLEPKIINLQTADPATAADYFSSAIWEMEGGTLILDEVDSISIKEGSCFDQYIRYGRNHDGDLVTGCRRPAEVDKNITAAANKFYCFQTHEYRDIEYFDSIFGERAEELLSMPKYSGLFMDYDNSLTGKFRIDIHGQIFHIEENPV